MSRGTASLPLAVDDGQTGFLMARQHFGGAGWWEQNTSTFVVYLGEVRLWIEAGGE